MAANELVDVTVEELVGGTPDEAVRGAVGAVLTHVVLLDNVARQGVTPGVLGHVVVEGGVGDDDVADLGEHLAADLDDVGLGVVVQRGERGNLAHPAQRLVGDDLGLGEVPTALNDAVADAVDGLVDSLENLEDVLDGGLVVGKRDLELLLAATHLLVADERAVDADALAVTLCVHLARVDVEQLVLERRAAGVDDENVHVAPLGGAPYARPYALRTDASNYSAFERRLGHSNALCNAEKCGISRYTAIA